MARGSPDYGIPDYSFYVVETPLGDVIAERQGFARLDNRGRVIYFDDFRQGLNRWTKQNGSGGVDPSHVYGEGLSIGWHGCALLDCVVNGGVSLLNNALVLPVSKSMGVEVGLRLLSNFGDVEISLGHNYNSASSKEAILFITGSAGAIKIYDNTSLTTVFTPSSVSQLLNSWISIKFVIDLENNKWVRCLIGNQQIELSNYALRNGVPSLQGYTEVIIRNTGVSGTLLEPWYCGYVVISGDEPI